MRLWWALALCATLGCCRGRGRGRGQGMFVMVLLVPGRTNGQNKPTSQPEATIQREKENEWCRTKLASHAPSGSLSIWAMPPDELQSRGTMAIGQGTLKKGKSETWLPRLQARQAC